MQISSSELWEVLVPTQTNSGQEVPVDHHQLWDDEVRTIAGGLTIMRTAKGQWIDEEGELFTDRVIPVRVACNEEQVAQVMELTLRHYGQKAVMAYRVSERALILHQEQA